MSHRLASDFAHITLDKSPLDVAGIVLLDEWPGFTGIYLRDPNGGLWPARTVDRSKPEHHESVINAWLSHEGEHEDRRKQRKRRYKSQAARDAQKQGYGGPSYWAELDRSCRESYRYFLRHGDKERAEMMMTRSLGESLRGNDGD